MQRAQIIFSIESNMSEEQRTSSDFKYVAAGRGRPCADRVLTMC